MAKVIFEITDKNRTAIMPVDTNGELHIPTPLDITENLRQTSSASKESAKLKAAKELVKIRSHNLKHVRLELKTAIVTIDEKSETIKNLKAEISDLKYVTKNIEEDRDHLRELLKNTNTNNDIAGLTLEISTLTYTNNGLETENQLLREQIEKLQAKNTKLKEYSNSLAGDTTHKHQEEKKESENYGVNTAKEYNINKVEFAGIHHISNLNEQYSLIKDRTTDTFKVLNEMLQAFKYTIQTAETALEIAMHNTSRFKNMEVEIAQLRLRGQSYGSNQGFNQTQQQGYTNSHHDTDMLGQHKYRQPGEHCSSVKDNRYNTPYNQSGGSVGKGKSHIAKPQQTQHEIDAEMTMVNDAYRLKFSLPAPIGIAVSSKINPNVMLKLGDDDYEVSYIQYLKLLIETDRGLNIDRPNFGNPLFRNNEFTNPFTRPPVYGLPVRDIFNPSQLIDLSSPNYKASYDSFIRNRPRLHY